MKNTTEHLIIFFMLMLIVASVSAFVIMLFDKFRVTEYLQVHGHKLVSQMANCRICICFWMNVIISIAVVVMFHEPLFIFIPVISTALTTRLVFSHR
jgi:hypothetical protein